jgi:aminocarboxymuconate-semialdehyde decarboxylase
VRRQGQPYDFGLGMLTDTATAAGELVFGGVLDDCPQLQVLLSHGCGAFPWAFPRLKAATALGGDQARSDHDALAARLWVDTMVFDPVHLHLLRHRFGADHIVFGSDFPFVAGQVDEARDFVDTAVHAGALTSTEVSGVLGENGRALLEKLRRRRAST